MSAKKQSFLSEWWKKPKPSNDNKPLPKKKRRTSNNENINNINCNNPRKRTRRQSNHENENIPLSRPRKKLKTNNYNKKIIKHSDDNNDNNNNDGDEEKEKEKEEEEEEEEEDIVMNDNDNNHNKNNGNESDDALSRIAQFDFNDDDDTKQKESIQRDSKYKYNSYHEYLSKQINDPNSSQNQKQQTISGDFSNEAWYKNPRDKSGRNRDDINYNLSQIYVPQSAYKKMKPLRAQWWKLKSDHFDGMLFFKKGNFYQLYYEDAYIGHKLTGMALIIDDTNTARCGLPEQSFNKFAECFVKHGYKVYRVEQTETAEEQKKRKGKLMKREICEVLTKGTLIPQEFLDERANYILSIVEEDENAITSAIDIGICYSDFSTGHIYIGHFTDDRNRSRLRTLIFQLDPSEIIYINGRLSMETKSLLKNECKMAVQRGLKEDDEFYDAQKTKDVIKQRKYWKLDPMPEVLQKGWNHKLTMNSFGGILYIMQHTMHDLEILPHSQWYIYDPRTSKCNDYLTLDGSTLANLEILRNQDGTRRGTLIEFVDKCQTKMGKRMLEQWLKYPLNKLPLIQERLDAVTYFIQDNEYWIEQIDINAKLKKLPDLERLLHHLAVLGTKHRMMDKAVMFERIWDKRKVKKLIDTLDAMEELIVLFDLIESHRGQIQSTLINDITTIINKDKMDCDDDEEEEDKKNDDNHNNKKVMNERYIPEFKGLIKEFKESFDREHALETGVIQPTTGWDEDYDDIEKDIIENEEELEKILKGIKKKYKTKSICWNHPKRASISGKYLVEIPKSLKIRIPGSWSTVSSTSKVDRHQTPEIIKLLKVRESLFDKKEMLERDYARHTFARFAKNGIIWRKIVENVSILDCLLSLAHISQYSPEFDMNRPEFIEDSKPMLEIRNGYHPCIDSDSLNMVGQQDGASQFIPNDTVLGCKENAANFVIVTGPNMGGKSTLLRQTCIAVILAHIGCYVPCKSMILTPVDRIFTRVGANDRILAGQSTFMVELEETSNILTYSTMNSLVILDELGRGTSTFDGTAIAFSVAKQLIDNIKCRCLFSTHYHGLTDSFIDNKKVAMYHMAYKQINDKITFLYKFTKGICKESHGINCAKLAGLPQFMLDRAEEKANFLHDTMHKKHGDDNKNNNNNDDDEDDEQELIDQFNNMLKQIKYKR